MDTPPLYKYLPIEFAKKLATTGQIKLGTLSEYQDEGALGGAIGDRGEGTLNRYSRVNLTNANRDQLNEFERGIISIGPGVEGVTLKDCLLTSNHKSEDYYIFSTSDLFSLPLMRKISSEYHTKYDACVRIHCPEKFMAAVSQALYEVARFEGVGRCYYQDRTMHHKKASPPPALVKPSQYSYQHEMRAIWSPLEEKTTGTTILEIPELTSYCELYYEDPINYDEHGIPLVENMAFSQDVIKLDESSFLRCDFTNSSLIFYGDQGPRLDTCQFNQCSFNFGGPALNTLNYLNALYTGLGESGLRIVEDIFSGIRGKTKP